MEQSVFSEQDLKQIEHQGLTLAEVNRQLELFNMPKPFLKLAGPCTVGDGIRAFDRKSRDALTAIYEREGPGRRCVKFVPASGAASRMFKVLLRYFHQDGEITRSSVAREASAGSTDAEQFLVFAEGMKNFAFFRDLQSMMADNGLSVDALLEQGRFRDILRLLLTDEGLDYAALPKGLLKFHEYPAGSRTAFEEHLVEAASYVADRDGRCALGFTVSPEHMDRFKASLHRARGIYEEKFGVSYDVSFSVQDPSTDTIAVDLDNAPFRQEDRRLLFRPGGHGALLKNLNHIDGDIIFIKNIDNVLPDHLKATTVLWKKALGGLLVEVQNQVHALARQLETGTAEPLLTTARRFFDQWLPPPFPPEFADLPAPEQGRRLRERLLRPLRVCGVVANTGEPGGGPFWVRGGDGSLSLQIVEQAQVRRTDPEQAAIWRQATHFNPVDLVCAVRDVNGRCFDLPRFRDPEAVFITRKSSQGKELKALELPGLWNGAMAYWNTIFVEVPRITFNPVKTVNDLLRPEHQGQ